MSNIEQQYLDLVKDILENGYTKGDRTGTGTKSVFGRTIRHRMSDGFPLLTTKKVAFKTTVTELLWFLRGDGNIKYLVDNGCHIWDGDAWANYSKKVIANNLHLMPASDLPKTKEEFINKIKTDDEFAKKWGYLGPIYGPQWRRWTKFEDESIEHNEWYKSSEPIDQIANAIHLLKTDPDSRRILVSAWNVGELDQMVLPPCHYSFQFYTRELSLSERYEIMKNGDLNEWLTIHYKEPKTMEYMDKHNIPKRAISLIWSQRSVDVGLGLPFNIASYALLLEIIAKEVNMIPEEVIGNLGDCHIYLNHVDGLKEQLTRVPYELPTLNVNENNKLRIGGGVFTYDVKDFTLENYQSHPAIKLPLSN